MDKILGDPTNAFERTDIIINGDVSFPRQNFKPFPDFHHDMPIGPLTLRFG